MADAWQATVTPQDVEFVRRARDDYRLFAETLEKQRESRAAGTMRAQEFYAERFLLRIGRPSDG